MQITVFASGSTGNCSLVSSGGENMLIDAGISLRRIASGMRDVEADPASLGGAIQTLLGYGAGLTPSGDDCLVGLLATLGARNRTHPDLRHGAICDVLRPRLVRTTDFGAALLANASDGHYDESLRRLLTLPADLPQALAEVAAHGHSSGHDTLCGVAWALPRLL